VWTCTIASNRRAPHPAGGQTYRDFVPWRLLDAGLLSARRLSSCIRRQMPPIRWEVVRWIALEPWRKFSLVAFGPIPMRTRSWEGQNGFFENLGRTLSNGVAGDVRIDLPTEISRMFAGRAPSIRSDEMKLPLIHSECSSE
jgi:hypothetical protein